MTETASDPAAIYLEEASRWETTRVQTLEQNARRARIVAGVATVVAALAIVAVAFMAPLKETTPYVVRVDDSTGAVDVVTALEYMEVKGDDVMAKYWLAKYVTHRETYNWWSLQTDYDTVGLMSSDEVGADYNSLFSGEDALHETYGNRVASTVEVISVVPTGKNTGTVRFKKTTKRRGGSSDVSRYVATIAYEFRTAERMRESDRLVNPFGFVVTSYRVDPELGGTS